MEVVVNYWQEHEDCSDNVDSMNEGVSRSEGLFQQFQDGRWSFLFGFRALSMVLKLKTIKEQLGLY